MDWLMRVFGMKLLAASALSLTLAACVPDAGLVDAGLVAPPAPQLMAGVYGPVADPQFTVPAVPVEKVPAEFQRQTVRYENETNQPVGTIIINPSAKHLYLITGKKTAVRYGIAVGRAGFQWSGEALITDRKNWPTWTPPPEMIDRKPELAKWEKGQPGGPENPLGARALYLTTNGVDYGYRIHGTPEWFSIGKNASSGCIRMINQDVMDLFERVPNGTKVIVLNADGSFPKGLNLPPKPPAKKKAAPAPAPIVVPQPAVMPVPVVTGAAPAVTPAPAAATPVLAPTKPAVLPSAAPAAAEPPACKVPLVAGVCPPEVKTTP
jgi:lipoprotein-anchoring transpeptidase ErfK/SrfK